jgi:DNA-binding response OmpR family regulator
MKSERTWHILLVDDEEAITANLAPLLERAGFKVSIAADGAQALDRVRQTPPDLIVLDVLINLPAEQGASLSLSVYP